MINSLLNGLVNFVFSLINSFLTPIDSFIRSNFPVISDGLNAINVLFSYVLNFIGYCVDMAGLTPVAIALIVGYYSFSILATWTAHLVKVVLKWWGAIVP